MPPPPLHSSGPHCRFRPHSTAVHCLRRLRMIRLAPASVRPQTSLPAVQNLVAAPTVQQRSPEPPQAPASPTHAPAWQVPLLPGQTESAAMQVPLAPQQPPPVQELSAQQPLPAIPQGWQMRVGPPPSVPAL